MDEVDHVFYINLDKRVDRREHIEAELVKYGIEAERFSAIPRPEQGILGCGQSHLNVIRIAKERGYKNVLIFEDDFVFLVEPEEFQTLMSRLFREAGDFDVCMLGYNMQQKDDTAHDFLDRVLFAQTASAYIIRQHYYDNLIGLYEWALPLLEQTKAHWLYANDVVWRDLQARDHWVAFKTRVGKQMDGYSDNTGRFMSGFA
jgi:GR25 family glycosyltransferase involved in LPS biosynthesis